MLTTIIKNLPSVFSLLVVAYMVVVIFIVVREDRDPTTTLAWILVLFLTPFFGLIFYFLFGRNWHRITEAQPRTKAMFDIEEPFMWQKVYPAYGRQARELVRDVDNTVEERVIAAIWAERGSPPMPVRTFDVYPSGEEYFPVLLDDLRSATDFIHMQYFIWEADELTAKVTEVLMDRLDAGVEVRILNDWWGNLLYDKSELKRLKAAGAHVGSDVVGLAQVNYRNHRKITVVDGHIGHTGGVNIGQEYIDGGSKYPAWRDTGLRITGPGVAGLEKLFARRWYEVYEQSLWTERYFPDMSDSPGSLMIQTVGQGVEDFWHSATRAYEIAISGARERVLLQSPYFVPDPGMFDVLLNAALSGVEVNLMMTGWPDKRIAFHAAESFFKPFLEAGGRIWQYERGFFHAKSLVVDGRVSSIGTMNMDVRSLRLHKELMVWCYDDAIAQRCERIWADDLTHCRAVTLDEVGSWSTAHKIRNSASRLASNLL